MRLYSYRRAPAIRWGVPAVLCASVLLTACEDDNYRPDPEPGEPTVTETSAPVALEQSTESYFAAPKVIAYGPLAINRDSSRDCDTSGNIQVETGSDNRVSSITYNDCYDFYGEGFWSLTSGVLEFEYDSSGTMIHITMDGFSEESILGDDQQRIDYDGTLALPTGPASPPSYTATGHYKYFRDFPSDQQNVELSFQDFQVQSSVSGTDIIQIMNGGISLPGSDRYLTVDTGSDGLRRPSGSSCAVSGTLTLTAADGSYTSATFNGEDHIVVSVNGVAQPERTCDEYLAFINH